MNENGKSFKGLEAIFVIIIFTGTSNQRLCSKLRKSNCYTTIACVISNIDPGCMVVIAYSMNYEYNIVG